METIKITFVASGLAGLLVAMLSGCSTKPMVHDITASLNKSANAEIQGIPFRVYTDHQVSIYVLSDEEDTYEKVSKSTQRLADMNRLFALNYSGGPFATNQLKVVENSDNTLKSMGLTSTDTSDKTIDAITSAVNGQTSAQAAKKANALTAAKAVVDADKAVRDAQKDLDALPSTASAETRALYERILESAKQQATAARAAAD
ncbi:MAG: hypothetical protein EOP36_01680 [Rubrivivax sp.]|nr:MAG: hypothetical protein EOP36_01680 [Rubrivivax sp.]